ncbi:hypothetical protein KC930_02435 [Candidatus Saccharibacteria bacterium]|nr:hypothetical protein [Candidatus Saccharibacteria bacterium]
MSTDAASDTQLNFKFLGLARDVLPQFLAIVGCERPTRYWLEGVEVENLGAVTLHWPDEVMIKFDPLSGSHRLTGSGKTTRRGYEYRIVNIDGLVMINVIKN